MSGALAKRLKTRRLCPASPHPIARFAVSLVAAMLVATSMGCSGPQTPRPARAVDEMHFVDDDAVATIRPPQRRRPLPAHERRSGGDTGERPSDNPAEARPAASALTARCSNERRQPALSLGRATAGSLESGCVLPKRGKGWVRVNRDGFGTDETVALIQWAAAQVKERFSRSPPVIVGAISRRGGGRLGKHKSHQSGRDADIGYYAVNNGRLRRFVPMGPRNLDVDKTWTFIGALLSTGRVQYIFMDYNLQARFYRYLEDLQTDPGVLSRVFQYPAGRSVRRGIIRHARGHRDHFHVRFVCPLDSAEACVQ